MRRREALGAGLFVAFGGLVAARDARAQDAPACERVKIFWGPNHGHAIAVPIEDARAKVKKTYVAQGKSDHAHVFTVTEDDWDRLAKGEPVRLASTKVGGHLHRVRLTCAPAADGPEDAVLCDIEIGGSDGHELLIPPSHLADKIERVYDIQGAAPHTHQVTVTAAHFERLGKGERLHLVASAGDGHTHLVAITKKK